MRCCGTTHPGAAGAATRVAPTTCRERPAEGRVRLGRNGTQRAVRGERREAIWPEPVTHPIAPLKGREDLFEGKVDRSASGAARVAPPATRKRSGESRGEGAVEPRSTRTSVFPNPVLRANHILTLCVQRAAHPKPDATRIGHVTATTNRLLLAAAANSLVTFTRDAPH